MSGGGSFCACRPAPRVGFIDLMSLLQLLLPKTWGTWCGAILLVAALFLLCGESVLSPSGIVIMAGVAASAVLASRAIPKVRISKIALLPPFPRKLIYALFAYALVATLGHLSEARSLRSWWELITVSGTAPFSLPNGLGVFAGVLAACTQTRYRAPVAAPRSEHVRGPNLISHQEALTRAAQQMGPDGQGFIWGAVTLPFSCATGHFCVVGEPGSGKTKTIQLLLKYLLPTIKPGSNRRALLYDAKRDLFSTLAGMDVACPVRTLHPFDRRGWAWDIAADVTSPMLAIEIATILIPEKAGEHQPYFPNAARALLSGVMESLHRSAPGQWTLRDVVLALRYAKRVRHLLKTSKDTRYLVEKYVTGKTSDQDVASTIENSMRRFSFVAAAWEIAGEMKLSLSDWAEKGEFVLLLGRSPLMESTFVELNRAILYRLAQIIRDQPNSDRAADGRPERQTWIVVDELSEAGKLDGFNSLLKEGRSKGACVVLGFQDMHGLEEVYGPRLGKELAGICRNKAFLRTTDPDTQKYASDCFGGQDIDLPRVSTSESWGSTSGRESTTSVSQSRTLSHQRLNQPVVLPSQFGSDLPPPSQREGLSGYYLTAVVGNPYFANIPGAFLDQVIPQVNAARLAEEQQDFLPRFKPDSSEINLKEWTEADLRRLNLEKFPELLETDEDEAREPSDDSWSGILRDR